MRLGGRLAAAIEVLDDIERRHRPATDALKDWGLSHRFAGAGDRAAIGNIVYDALRRKRSAGWLFGNETSRALGFGALLLEWNQSAAALNQALDGDKFSPSPLSAAELYALSERKLTDAPDVVRADSPDWCAPLLGCAFGTDWVEESAALASRPPLDIRVNTLKVDRDRVIAELEGTRAAPTDLAPNGVRIPPIDGSGRHPNVQAEPAFQKGWFEIQDEGSQLAAALAGAEPGMQVLDFCAGAGGKTLALSAAMNNRGLIFAFDSEKSRLALMFDRLRRSDNRNVQVVSKPSELSDLIGHMDLVLIDAPCTGSGTWRRRPDAKWRLTRRQLDVRKAEQSSILDSASIYVKPGGLVIYITCSVFDEENVDQIAAFFGRNMTFTSVDHTALWNEHCPGKQDTVRFGRYGLSMTPARSGTDGLYFAAMYKAA